MGTQALEKFFEILRCRFRMQLHSIVIQPAAVRWPGARLGQGIAAHHRHSCQQSQQAKLRKPAEEQHPMLPGEPMGSGGVVYMALMSQGQPDIHIREKG